MNKNIKHIVWDWNGTLLNDRYTAVESINILLERYNFPKITMDKYLEIFSFPVIDYYKRLGFDFDKTPFSVVGTEFIEEYTSRMYDVEMQDGAKEILKYFYEKGVSQSLVSAAKQQMLNKLMKHHEIEKYFIKVSGLSDHYANSKIEVGKAWVKELNIPNTQIIFVGDTLHDVEVAKEIGANCALVAKGHAPYERLASSGEVVFHNLSEFKKWFTE